MILNPENPPELHGFLWGGTEDGTSCSWHVSAVPGLAGFRACGSPPRSSDLFHLGVVFWRRLVIKLYICVYIYIYRERERV